MKKVTVRIDIIVGENNATNQQIESWIKEDIGMCGEDYYADNISVE